MTMSRRSPRSPRPRPLEVAAAVVLAGVLVQAPAYVRSPAHGETRTAACDEPLPDLFARVSPAVVSISATSINPYRLSERVSHVVGSGVLFDAGGLILTNSHLAYGRQSITVTLDDGTRLAARLVGADPIFDLAVLRVAPPSAAPLPTVSLGDSDRVRVGDEVVAIGNPIGFDQTLTRGIVSGMNRILPETPFSLQEPLIQTDAPINPGNSGGPLVNRCGDVVGINTFISEEANSIGFALPVNAGKAILRDLRETGRVIRPWLGLQGREIDSQVSSILRLPLSPGYLVEVVYDGSPADRAGVRGGSLSVVVQGEEYLPGGDRLTAIDT